MAQYDLIFIRNGHETGIEFMEVSLAKPGALGRYLTQNPSNGSLSWATVDWTHIGNKPATFTPATHSHGIADITNLQTTLNGKEPTITVLPASKGGTGSASLPAGMIKGNGTGSLVGAVAGTDFVIPSGNVATATKLATARTINGVSFDGSANITINAVDATARIASIEKGAANGVATLDANSKVPASQLPSYVDDVLEYANLAALPGTGEQGKIYTTIDTNKIYRWSGTAYIEISPTAGNADTATKLATPRAINGTNFDGTAAITTAKWGTGRTISISGDATGSQSIDGSANASIALTLATVATAGTFPKITFNAKGLVTGGAALGAADIPALAISKISGLQTALDGKVDLVSAPASLTSTGTAGQIAYGSNYLYVCVAANTWRRVTLSSWGEFSE